MTDNEIIKALECCLNNECDNCSLKFKGTLIVNETCGIDLMKLALDLINRQKAEIERLKKHIQEGIDLAKQIPEMLALTKAEAYKEFAEILKEQYKPYVIMGSGIAEIEIDKTYKKLVGEDN